ncbi:nSTAND3 domain-containing NTPase [Flavobacterium muglaense]|uniref:Novel STAND NTPase 3 domain-containing protein n=1 Tax=Flavobacterium muglaense TaxID=2764716 RepID=A0A923N085_9FLAO|nr:hypothetical protein [Flavobacterium muglaense]MBC5836712.1 hypothetical protein [Flavobacterium muglaense]MBC5843338.1 hypothetical protein [Flavobacterium muglaense]
MITSIEQALLSCNPDKFANICRLYLGYRYPIVNPTGLVVGKEKSKKGTPDNFISDNDSYIFSEITTIDKNQLVPKLKKDIEHCFNQNDISSDKIIRIILICNQEITTKIQEELNEHKNSINEYTKLEVIGLDAFATIIFRDFPSLSKELGLTIDTGQILEMSEFVIQYEKSKFATPLSNAFFNRETELDKGIELLQQYDFVLITGQAGVGKTKFSIQLVTNYLKSNPGYIVKYIRNNNQLIWDDLKIQITKNKKYIIVVDDANKLKSNLTSIIHFKNEFNSGDIKIIMTVRNYLKQEIEYQLKENGLIELANFEKSELAKILQSPEFNINDYYTDKIHSISKGNPRIALMGAIAGINNEIEKLTKASLILEEYFSSANNTIKDDLVLLKTAGILTLFRSIDVSNSGVIDEISKHFDITKNELVEKLSLLVKNEIADEYKNTYKIADQILGEYIFYLIFIKEQHIPFKQLLNLYFDERKISLMSLLNPIISNYGFHEIKDFILYDVNQKWNSIQEDQHKSIKFLESFWFYLETETIVFINKIISSETAFEIDNLKFEIYKDNSSELYDDKIISLLVSFQNLPDKFEVALTLLLKYGLSSELRFAKILKVFTQSFTYKRFSYESDYKIQINLFNFLYSKVNENSLFYSKIILFIADKYLIDSYECYYGGNGRQFYFNQEYIVLNEEQKNFRTKLFEFIFNCYKNAELKDSVYDFFEKHRYSHLHQNEKTVINFDRKLIIPFFEENFNNGEFRESSIIHNYIRKLGYLKIKIKKEVKDLVSSKEFRLWLLLDEKFERKEKIINNFSDYTFDDYIDLMHSLNIIYENKYGNYSCFDTITSPVSDTFENLANKDFNLFIKVLKKVFEYEYSKHLYFRKIISNINFDIDKVKILQSVLKNTVNIDIYLLEFFTRIPNEYIKIEDYNYIVGIIQKDDFKTISFIDDILKKISDLDLNFEFEIEKLLDIIILKTELNDNMFMYGDFFIIINDQYQSAFIKNLKKIEKIYLYLDKSRRHFDYDLKVLKIILLINPHFIIDLLKYNFADRDYLSRRDFDENDFKKLWDLNNYGIVFENMINYLVNFKSLSLHRASEFSSVFKGDSQKAIDFLHNQLLKTGNKKIIELIFNIISSIYKDKMLDFLKIILDKNCDSDLFKKLDFYISPGVTMGSRLPNMQFELSQLEKVRDFLVEQNNINYYEFIEIINRNIMYSKMSIESERKREFVSEWD